MKFQIINSINLFSECKSKFSSPVLQFPTSVFVDSYLNYFSDWRTEQLDFRILDSAFPRFLVLNTPAYGK